MRISTCTIALAALVVFSHSASAQQYCQLGSQQWITGCEASCTASWEGGNCPQQCTATPPPGFVIVNHKGTNVSENNGGHSLSRISAGQSFNYSSRVESAYKTAIDAAAKKGNTSVSASLREEMSQMLAVAQRFESSHQLVRLEVHASRHGSVIDRRRGWSHHRVEILVQCVLPQDLQGQLFRKYAL